MSQQHRRKAFGEAARRGESQASRLPEDFLSMVHEVLHQNFDDGLKKLAESKSNPKFQATGHIFQDEVLLTISLVNDDELAATSVHASVDFDPQANSPTLEDLLNACVDASGGLFAELFEPGRIEALTSETPLTEIEGLPLEWTQTEVNKKKVYLRIDKSNPQLDEKAENWLKDNDPEYEKQKDKEQKEMEDLFVTSPSQKQGNDQGSDPSDPLKGDR